LDITAGSGQHPFPALAFRKSNGQLAGMALLMEIQRKIPDSQLNPDIDLQEYWLMNFEFLIQC
jgi:hypothetical protein